MINSTVSSMAKYAGVYRSDIGIQYQNVLLETFLYRNGKRTPTSYAMDEKYLPTIFLLYTQKAERRKDYCEINYRSIRRALCYLGEDWYYEIPCPFLGGTEEFKQFFQELNNSPKPEARFRVVELKGESLFYSFYLYLRANV